MKKLTIRKLSLSMIVILNISVFFKNIHNAYKPCNSRVFELVIIWLFLVSISILIIVVEYNSLKLKLWSKILSLEYLVAFFGFCTSILDRFFNTESVLYSDLLKIISLGYYLTAIIGLFIVCKAFSEINQKIKSKNTEIQQKSIT